MLLILHPRRAEELICPLFPPPPAAVLHLLHPPTLSNATERVAGFIFAKLQVL